MQHQLLGGKSYNEVSITQDGIELNTLNDTSVVDSKATNRKNYVNLDDISENVVYAENKIKNDYAPLSNGSPKSQPQQQQQQLNQKTQQQQSLSAQQVGQQQQFQSGQMSQQNYPGLVNGRAPVISQQAFNSPQQQQQYQQYQQRLGQQQIYQPSFVQPNPSSMYATNNVGPNQYNPTALTSSQYQFGMSNLSEYELQQQIQLQQKILDDIAKAKANSTQQSQQNQQQQQQKPAQQSQAQASQLKGPQQQQVQQSQQQLNNQKPAPQQQMQQQQPSVIGKMEVKCAQCLMMQRIPICSKKFQCYNCCTIQESISQMPVYSMFLCGNCQARVLFEPGTSDYIQCTRCQIVNKIGETNDKKQVNSSLLGSRANSLPTDTVQKPPILKSPVLQPQQQVPQSIFQQQIQPPLQQVQDQPKAQQQLYPSLQANPKPLEQQQQQQTQTLAQQKEQDELAQIEKDFDNMIAGNGESKSHDDQLESLQKEKAELQKQLDQHKELVQNQSLIITQAQQQQQQLQQQVLLQKQQQQQQQQLSAPQNSNTYPPQQNQQIPSSMIYRSEMPAQGQAVSSYGVTSVYQGAQISNAQL